MLKFISKPSQLNQFGYPDQELNISVNDLRLNHMKNYNPKEASHV